jgi:hypothetical protein
MRRTLLIGGAVAASRILGASRVPDDYDSIGFVLALDQFDVARLQPHFPGYPVYVALGKLAHLAIASALLAAQVISALASGATAVGVWKLTRKLAGERAALCALGLYAAAWLPWLHGGSALGDATATAFCLWAFLTLVDERPLASGILMALMLGARASYWPLALSWLVLACSRRAWRALAGGAAGLVGWLLAFALQVGPRHLVELGRQHVAGHFGEWGGSIATRPELGLRVIAFARDLFFDGFAPHPLALAVVALALVWSARQKRPSRRPWITGAIVVGPYALWCFFAQNIIEQPRHVLPLVVAASLAMGWLLAEQSWMAAAAVGAMLAVSLPLAVARARTLPAAAQAVAWAKGQEDIAVFGGRSIRFFALLAPEIVAHPRTHIAEVDVDLERLRRLPQQVFVTSEVEPDRWRAARIGGGPTFCRDPRIDRQQPCLGLRQYALKAAR